MTVKEYIDAIVRLSEEHAKAVEQLKKAVEELSEQHKPAEPLIKDEKIRKVVRAWAELNDFSKVKLLVSPEYGSQFEGGYGFGRITFTGRTLDLDYPKEYTIAELCGEEEE